MNSELPREKQFVYNLMLWSPGLAIVVFLILGQVSPFLSELVLFPINDEFSIKFIPLLIAIQVLSIPVTIWMAKQYKKQELDLQFIRTQGREDFATCKAHSEFLGSITIEFQGTEQTISNYAQRGSTLNYAKLKHFQVGDKIPIRVHPHDPAIYIADEEKFS